MVKEELEKIAETTVGVGVEEKERGAEAPPQQLTGEQMKLMELDEMNGMLEVAKSSSVELVVIGEGALMGSEANEQIHKERKEEEEVEWKKKAHSNNKPFSAADRSQQPNNIAAGRDRRDGGDVAGESLAVTAARIGIFIILRKC